MAKKKANKVRFGAAKKSKPKKPRNSPPRPHGAWRAYVSGGRGGGGSGLSWSDIPD
jgi:hypothetical protein